MEPSNARVRLLELVNAVRRLPTSGVSEQVRRATVALAEAMDIEGLTAGPVRGEDSAESAANTADRNGSQRSTLPPALKARIERIAVRWRDHDHALEVTRVAPYPRPPLHRVALDVTVRTRHLGRDVEVTCRVRPAQFDQEEAIAGKVAEAVQAVLEGRLPSSGVVVL